MGFGTDPSKLNYRHEVQNKRQKFSTTMDFYRAEFVEFRTIENSDNKSVKIFLQFSIVIKIYNRYRHYLIQGIVFVAVGFFPF